MKSDELVDIERKNENNAIIEIICFTDPYCTWCWGSEPILRKIQEVYADQVKISYMMGGLVKDIGNFSDPSNGIAGAQWYRQVADHWVQASQQHKMPVDEQIFSTSRTISYRATLLASRLKQPNFRVMQLQAVIYDSFAQVLQPNIEPSTNLRFRLK